MKKAHRFGKIVLMGPPNAGKSTLVNALVGQKISIVTDKPQTTRNQIIGICSEPGAQIVFMDTPGLHYDKTQMRGPLAKMMIQSAWQSLTAADAVLLVLDGGLYVRRPEYMGRDVAAFHDALAGEERPVFIVFNKVDLFHDKAKMLPVLQELQGLFPKAEIFPMSALNKDGLAELKAMLVAAMPEGEAEFPEDQLSTAPMRFLASEIIREKLFERLRQEVPYSTAVDIEAWEDDPDGEHTLIHAVIYVARQSHKAIVIGHAGAGIKEIGTAARKDIEALTGTRVNLRLWVKVKENWIDEIKTFNNFDAEEFM